jgi:hypothetical protein
MKRCSIKHFRCVKYRLSSKLVCLSKVVCLWLTIEKTLAYYKICKFPVNYESLLFYSIGPYPRQKTIRLQQFSEKSELILSVTTLSMTILSITLCWVSHKFIVMLAVVAPFLNVSFYLRCPCSKNERWLIVKSFSEYLAWCRFHKQFTLVLYSHIKKSWWVYFENTAWEYTISSWYNIFCLGRKLHE